MNEEKLEDAIHQALAAPAAPARLVEQVFAKTTRRPGWWVRYKTALVGGVAAVLVGVCVSVGYFHRAAQQEDAELIYMKHAHLEEYAAFVSDLNLFEQEF